MYKESKLYLGEESEECNVSYSRFSIFLLSITVQKQYKQYIFLLIIVKLRQGSGKDRQLMSLKAKGLKANPCLELTLKLVVTHHHHHHPPISLILLN